MAMSNSFERKNALHEMSLCANILAQNSDLIVSILRRVESRPTALDEIDKTIRALKTYDRELPRLRNRVSDGDVAVFLPFNNPLYSFVLYSFGPALAGAHVLVRPSRITRDVLLDIIDVGFTNLSSLNIELLTINGSDFVNRAISDPKIKSIIFTGIWENVTRLLEILPQHKRLIYCGSGINPFIIAPSQFTTASMDVVVDLAIRSRLYNSGQDCLCTERIYIHKTIINQFVETLIPKLKDIICGDMDDEEAEVTPLIDGRAEYLDHLFSGVDGTWHVDFKRSGNLVFPSVIEVDIDSEILIAEKYGPVFTISRYDNEFELDVALDSMHRFGATIVGEYNSEILESYPHVTRSRTVIDKESEDAHSEFGGRRRSGFVKIGDFHKDGPILFSVETSHS